MQRSKRSLPKWQIRWVSLHDDLHLLEVLLEAIIPSSEYTAAYWQLSSEVINFGQALQEAYEQVQATISVTSDAGAYQTFRQRLRGLQARAQQLSLENDLS